MKKISRRLTIALFSLQLTLVYLLGTEKLSVNHPALIFIMLPVIAVLALGMWQLEELWKRYKYDSHHLKMKETVKNLWFWILLCISTGFIIGIMYYASQLLLPEAEICQNFTFNNSAYQGTVLLLIICSVSYVVLMIWMKKTLKNIWKD